jgi:hypothetical protein
MNVPTEAGAASAVVATDHVELEHLLNSARDALTDDIVTRMSGAVAGGLDLLDRVNRSGIAKALPAITHLVENGDLERLVGLARLVGAMEDALTDDIIGRVATVVAELVALVDKLARNPGFMRLIDVLGREEVQCGLIDLAEAACAAKKDAAALPPAGGGVFGFLRTASDPGVTSTLRYLSVVANHMRARQTRPD